MPTMSKVNMPKQDSSRKVINFKYWIHADLLKPSEIGFENESILLRSESPLYHQDWSELPALSQNQYPKQVEKL